jgi:hypothetical protein
MTADATGPFHHGTRADLAPGDPLTPGFTSNHADRKLSWIYFSGRPRAHGRRGRPRDHRLSAHPIFRGLPPFAPFARAAAAFAGELVRPALAAIHRAVPNTPFISPLTV